MSRSSRCCMTTTHFPCTILGTFFCLLPYSAYNTLLQPQGNEMYTPHIPKEYPTAPHCIIWSHHWPLHCPGCHLKLTVIVDPSPELLLLPWGSKAPASPICSSSTSIFLPSWLHHRGDDVPNSSDTSS